MILPHRNDTILARKGSQVARYSGHRRPALVRTATALAITGLGLALCATVVAPSGLAGPSTAVLAASTSPSEMSSTTTAAGTSAGVITMTEGAMEMRMTRLSGQAPTWTDIQQAYRRLAPYQALVTRYRDPAAALRDGYVTAPFLDIDGQGAHYIQHAAEGATLNGSGAPGRLAPPVLVYDTVHGKQTLAGLMFVLPAGSTPQQMAAVFPPSMASWHQHINSCVAGDQSKILPIHDQYACSKVGGFFQATTGWMAHAWIGQAGETGLFDMNFSAAPAGRPVTTGTPMTMTEGAMQMQMTPLSGQAPTWTEISRVYKTVTGQVAATAKYRDLAAARRDGYTTAPILFVDGQGAHYLPDRGKIALAQRTGALWPPVLVYDTIHGRQTLAGLMYLMPAGSTPRQLAAVFPASMASWHRHINVCISRDGNRVLPIHDQAACSAQGGSFVRQTEWMVHTWIGPVRNTGLFDLDMNQGAGSGTAMNNMPGMHM